MENKVPFNELPYEIREQIMNLNNKDWFKDGRPENSNWIFRKIPLDDLNDINKFIIHYTTPNDHDDEEKELINKFKNECMELRCCIPLIISEKMGVLIDGYHHLTAFRDAVEEDDTIERITNCWVHVD